MRENETVVVIPCRMDSDRLPGKPLLKAGDRSLVHRVYNRAKQTVADRVVVATSDEEIITHCRMHDLDFCRTKRDHATGTHRCAEVLSQFSLAINIGAVVDWQCDEPQVEPGAVNRLIGVLHRRFSVISTLVGPVLSGISLLDPNMVKVAVSSVGRAHWFSRAPMHCTQGHCGVYAFRSKTLRALGELQPTRMSTAESLEQLAWLEAGFQIDAVDISKLPLAINDQSDWEKFKQLTEGE